MSTQNLMEGEKGGNDSTTLIRRYPGPHAFEDNPIHPHLFYGRAQEIKELSSLVQARRTLVLFGRSGLGKTSLI